MFISFSFCKIQSSRTVYEIYICAVLPAVCHIGAGSFFAKGFSLACCPYDISLPPSGYAFYGFSLSFSMLFWCICIITFTPKYIALRNHFCHKTYPLSLQFSTKINMLILLLTSNRLFIPFFQLTNHNFIITKKYFYFCLSPK